MGALLGACAIVGAAACGDVPTAAEPSARTEALDALERSAGRGTSGGTVEVVCSISYATHGGAYAYQYGRITVKLPAASRSRDGSRWRYRFRNYAGTQIVGAANCTIPATEVAAVHMDRFFGVKQRGGRRVEPSGGAVLMGGDTHTLPTIEVNACQYGDPTNYPYCDPPPIDWEKNGSQKEQQVCRTDCGGGGGGPGGNTPEPPEEEEEEPCDTGDPVVDSPAVQEAMQRLWQNSNPGANLIHRKEQGGWIIRNADGSHDVVPWTTLTTSFCGADGEALLPTTGEVVGFFHTHPYAVGETITTCGFTSVQNYEGKQSAEDIKLGLYLGTLVRRSTPLPGYILDADGIRRFAKDAPTIHHARCGSLT